jgi:hypothetical protein
MLKPDGNGGFNISKTSTVTLGLALVIVGMVGGLAVAWATHVQALQDHINDNNVHLSKTDLDTMYCPRTEIQAELAWIKSTLKRVEEKVDRMGG